MSLLWRTTREQMNLSPEQLRQLAKKYVEGNASEEEAALLHQWYDSVNAGDTETVLTEAPETRDQFSLSVWMELKKVMAAEKQRARSSRSAYPLWRRAAAAVLLLVAGYAGFHYWQESIAGHLPDKNTAAPLVAGDVTAPAHTKAVLTLANGQQVILDSISSGYISRQGNARVEKTSTGQIAYTVENSTADIQYNTLTVPRGSRAASIILADGTKVWLNVASSITYPTAFAGKERSVKITGEAYFEVASNPAMPFIVTQPNTAARIQVLGTHFNVNAYDGEPGMKVTLLEGSVKVSKNDRLPATVLTPGQQALVAENAITVTKNVAVDEVVAWKAGLFIFNKTDIRSMMRQAERWYDIIASYPNGAPADEFSGSLSRNVNLSQFLKIMEYSDIKIKITGKNVIINP